jgi:hypothetical protein
MKLESEGNTEQLLPDFYAEDMTNAMNRDRRKEVRATRIFHLLEDLILHEKSPENCSLRV